MGKVISKASFRFSVPKFVEGYYDASKNGEYEECSELKENFYKTYNKFDSGIQAWMKSYISNYLKEQNIDNKRDLGGLFDPLNLKLN